MNIADVRAWKSGRVAGPLAVQPLRQLAPHPWVRRCECCRAPFTNLDEEAAVVTFPYPSGQGSYSVIVCDECARTPE